MKFTLIPLSVPCLQVLGNDLSPIQPRWYSSPVLKSGYQFKYNSCIGFHQMFASRLMMWRQNGLITKILILFIAASWATPSKTGPDLFAKVMSTFAYTNCHNSSSMNYLAVSQHSNPHLQAHQTRRICRIH